MGCILGLSIFNALPSNVVSVRDGSSWRVFWADAFPQSWAFFTKPPSDPEIVAYGAENGKIEYATLTPNGQRSNLYGVSRKQRAQGPELAHLANSIPERLWVECDPGQDCLEGVPETKPKMRVDNTSPVPTLCGHIVLVETEPVPWSYRGKHEGWRLDVRRAQVTSSC